MRIKKEELEVLRRLELGLDLTAETPDLVKKFQAENVIESFGIRFFIPQVVGGKWYFVLARISGFGQEIINQLDYPVEAGFNISIPENLLPNLTISFYTQNPKKEDSIIGNLRPDHFETTVMAEYNFPISLPLSQEEVKIIEILLETPLITTNEIATRLNLSSATVRAKLSRLQLDQNKKGLITVVPSINWSMLENFVHFHIGLETGLSQKMVAKRLKELGHVGAGWYRGTIYQIEFDMWQPVDLGNIMAKLTELNDLRPTGLLFAQKSLVIDNWIANIIKDTQ